MTALGYGNLRAKGLYDRLPVAVQNCFGTIYGFRQRAQIYNRRYAEALAALGESQWFDQERVLEVRDAACARFLRQAATDSPYWREVFADRGLRGDDLSVGALEALPVLSKEQARRSMDRIISRQWVEGRRRGVPVHTSGTTGMGLHFIASREFQQREYAFRDLHRSWGGVRPGDRIATVAGHPVVPTARLEPPFWRRNRAFNQTLFSSQHMTTATLPFYLEELRRLAPRMIHGYPSSLYVIALFCLESGEDGIRPLSVFTHSETLFEWQRAAIERAFACKVFNWYGNSEGTANIVECERGRLHVKNEYSVVEFLRIDGTRAEPGEYARVVGTGFGNDATPLVRYDTGDMAITSAASCGCGRPGPLVDAILGRQEDIFVTPDGRLVGRLDHVFKDALNVVEAQLVQDEAGLVVAKIVRRPGYGSSDEANIVRELRLRLGDAITLAFDYVERIPREKNGKFRFAVSRVPLPIGHRD